MNKPAIITNITTLEELDGYEAEAKKRGLQPDEIRALHARRKQLMKGVRK